MVDANFVKNIFQWPARHRDGFITYSCSGRIANTAGDPIERLRYFPFSDCRFDDGNIRVLKLMRLLSEQSDGCWVCFNRNYSASWSNQVRQRTNFSACTCPYLNDNITRFRFVFGEV